MTSNAFRPDARSAQAGQSSTDAYPRLRVAVQAVWGLFIAYCLYRLNEEPAVIVASAIAIATISLFPAYLWAKGQARGLPILPLQMLTILWTYAFPLAAGHPEIANYDHDEVLFALMCIAIYGAVATVTWHFVATRPLRPRSQYYVLPQHRGFTFFVTSIFVGGLFLAAAVGQVVEIGPGLFGVLRAAILAMSAIAFFVLSARMASGALTRRQAYAFLAVAAFYVTVQLTTIFLVGAIVSVASAFIGFTLGRGRVPWVAIVVSVVFFGFLQSGKAEMRERYWGTSAPPVAVYEAPILLSEWMVLGAENLVATDPTYAAQPLHERVSLMHILLLAQRSAPIAIPYLNGETYAIIPRLLVPRFVDPDKPDSHQATAMLNMHFGLQGLDESETTTIGWGLLNEAYANFGIFGMAGLGVLLGVLFGYAGRVAAGAPVMSLDSMLGVIFAAAAIQAEYTMALLVTVLFQSLAVLVLVMPLLEKRRVEAAA